MEFIPNEVGQKRSFTPNDTEFLKLQKTGNNVIKEGGFDLQQNIVSEDSVTCDLSLEIGSQSSRSVLIQPRSSSNHNISGGATSSAMLKTKPITTYFTFGAHDVHNANNSVNQTTIPILGSPNDTAFAPLSKSNNASAKYNANNAKETVNTVSIGVNTSNPPNNNDKIAYAMINDLKKQLEIAKQAKDLAEIKASRIENEMKSAIDQNKSLSERNNRYNSSLG